ncbi:MAG: Imidazoleglycerol-phosphate synthase HisF [uncultured bacterium]|nr:MAG: Imidazoleglycerol-phosphate synthase HisF [uncultured bacterium]
MLILPPLPPRVIPCLLLYEEAFVKTKKFKNPTYIGDPVNTINLFNKFEVDEIMVLDISCIRKQTRPNFQLIEEIASECWVPLTYGGGIQSVEEANKILNSGVEKILVESIIFSNPQEVRKCVSEFGSSSVVGCLNIAENIFGRYELRTQGNHKKAPLSLDATIALLDEIKVGEIVINHISRDGTHKGYDINLIHNITTKLNCPVVALGGASCIKDFKKAINAGASAVSAGSYFVFQNTSSQSVLINYPSRKEIEILFNEK